MHSPEKMLWLEVIKRAQDEAAGEMKEPQREHRIYKYLAYRWLRSPSPDLEEICDMAGLTDHDMNMLIEIERDKWRSE